ncbi:microfibril-associated glycoprotein 4-like [Amphibalanus amphitrite]|uniref:microfibril-associated glycoprotein 4-like n=1 Tax=Amphibalanus amphitrite TaxID=1232801 RepID=UPI001C8FBFBA|nr:microfibril-associated glycoprotein 4-like [Amphibalanus amphitrite]
MGPSAYWAVTVTVVCALACRSFALVGYSTSDSGSEGGEDDDLAAVIDRNIRAAVEGVVDILGASLNTMKTELTSQLEAVQTDLEGQLDRLETRLMTRIQRLEAQVNDVTPQMMSHIRDVQMALTQQNTDLSARLQDTQSQLQSQMEVGSDNMFSQLVDMQSQLLTALLTPRDCSDLPDSARSGVYLLWPSPNRAVPAFCDLSSAGGRWTVIQRRADIRPRTDFNLGWEAYGRGFGAVLGEFWWGNENLYRLTAIQGRHYELRVELESADGETKTATYRTFRVSGVADGYRLTVSGYSGDAGDSLSGSSGHKFSTRDRDQDGSEDHCAALWEAGWWYGACPHSNLNGPYLAPVNSSSLYGVVWPQWLQAASLKAVEMKIRPTESPATGVVSEPYQRN